MLLVWPGVTLVIFVLWIAHAWFKNEDVEALLGAIVSIVFGFMVAVITLVIIGISLKEEYEVSHYEVPGAPVMLEHKRLPEDVWDWNFFERDGWKIIDKVEIVNVDK